jgi:hypothetical protein
MGLYSTNRFRNLTAEYVEESMKSLNEAPDVSDPVKDVVEVEESSEEAVNEAPDVSDPEKDKVVVEESDDYIDSLLEALN